MTVAARRYSERPPGQRVVMIAAPLLLIAFSLLHGGDFILQHGLSLPDEEELLAYLAGIPRHWQALHVFGLLLFPLLGGCHFSSSMRPAFTIDHSPPFGVIAGFALGLTVWRQLLYERQERARTFV